MIFHFYQNIKNHQILTTLDLIKNIFIGSNYSVKLAHFLIEKNKNLIMNIDKKTFNTIFNDFDMFFNDFLTLGAWPSILTTQKESGSDSQGDWNQTTFKTNDGRVKVIYLKRNSTNTDGTQLSKLQVELNKAIETQDFESAVKLRDQINELKRTQNIVKDLEGELREMIRTQNFERAIELRDEIKKHKNL